MPRSPSELRKAFVEHAEKMPSTGWESGEDYRRHTTLEHGGDPDDLACVVCGVKVKHEDARIVIGLSDADNDFDRVQRGLEPENRPMPPVAFCPKHSGDEEVTKLAILGLSTRALPTRAKAIYGALRQV